MNRYLAQLLEDIEAATAAAPQFERQSLFDTDEDFFDEEEAFTYRKQEILGAIIGIEQVQLPPADRMTEDQITPILYALEHCLDTYGYRPEFPAYLQPRYYYTLLRTQLRREVPLLMGEVFPLYLCVPTPESNCLLGESCQCKDTEIWEVEDSELELDDTLESLRFPHDFSSNPFLSDPDLEEDEEDWE